jgi:hypothetical protein
MQNISCKKYAESLQWHMIVSTENGLLNLKH